ncbi:DNA-3-methyladenine glycosylase [Aquibacillus koreensis]|uniref:Putative 3-methyladenine DNA glycosylase n=1 Tax=Aquibacillus koreensis TaxID=279446 RepID=A0A9X3WLR8_9BACI|nr:DNA-3-methyladenine glycosylase [Aquibacillus koreensis]MCT2536162.1 DNA-3-methyladenine glycosylase [Aquibacillus koreensis]MDC3422087.1 DNA-3-methyladenine glycosylase [Aquibacillus koreensis]
MENISSLKPLPRTFYKRPTLDLAEQLLGCIIIKETLEGIAAGTIVETEAYIGPEDQAAHSYQNRRTKRTEVMFGPPGYTYTYSMHTHCLFNVVSGKVDHPEAVLIRAIEPYYNIELMRKRRNKIGKERDWTNGPGKLTKALGITMDDYGHQLTDNPLWIAKGDTRGEMVSTGPRIGIDNAGEAKNYPWRFWLKGNTFVSR